jgi:hypothetical protein
MTSQPGKLEHKRAQYSQNEYACQDKGNRWQRQVRPFGHQEAL